MNDFYALLILYTTKKTEIKVSGSDCNLLVVTVF